MLTWLLCALPVSTKGLRNTKRISNGKIQQAFMICRHFVVTKRGQSERYTKCVFRLFLNVFVISRSIDHEYIYRVTVTMYSFLMRIQLDEEESEGIFPLL